MSSGNGALTKSEDTVVKPSVFGLSPSATFSNGMLSSPGDTRVPKISQLSLSSANTSSANAASGVTSSMTPLGAMHIDLPFPPSNVMTSLLPSSLLPTTINASVPLPPPPQNSVYASTLSWNSSTAGASGTQLSTTCTSSAAMGSLHGFVPNLGAPFTGSNATRYPMTNSLLNRSFLQPLAMHSRPTLTLPFSSSFPTHPHPLPHLPPPSTEHTKGPHPQGLSALSLTRPAGSHNVFPLPSAHSAGNAFADTVTPNDPSPPVEDPRSRRVVSPNGSHAEKAHAAAAAAAAAATAAAVSSTSPGSQLTGSDGGNSCHQCKNNKPLCEIIFCMNPHTDPRTMRKCRKKFCFACLARGYDVHLPRIEDVDQWVCPACDGLCTCAACKRAAEKAGADSKAREHEGRLPKCSKSKPKADLNAHLRDAHAKMRAQGGDGAFPPSIHVPDADTSPDAGSAAGEATSEPLLHHKRPLEDLPGLPLPGLPLPGLPLPVVTDLGGADAGDEKDEGVDGLMPMHGRAHVHGHQLSHSHSGHKRRRLGDMDLTDADCSHPECAEAELCQFPNSPPLQPLQHEHVQTMPERGTAVAAAVFDEASESECGSPTADLPPLSRAQGATLSAQLRSSVAPSSPLALAMAPQAFALTRLPPTVVFGGDDSSVVRLAEVDDAGWDLSLLLAAGVGGPTRSDGLGLDSGQVTPLALRSRPSSADSLHQSLL